MYAYIIYRIRSVLKIITLIMLHMQCAQASDLAIEFPVCVYDKSEISETDVGWREYYGRIFSALDDLGLNCIVSEPYRDAKSLLYILDLAEHHGIGVIMSVGNPLSRKWDFSAPGYPFFKAYRHPAVIAYKYGDEPKDKTDVDRLEKSYRAIRVHHKNPIVTAVIGEAMTRNEQDVTLKSWARLKPDVRMARYYPFRRTYSIVDQYHEKTKLPFETWAALMEESGSQPWWYILQAFGKGIYPENKSYWRFPTEAEVTAMAHIALAHDARGLVAYSLQNHKGRLTGLMNAELVLNKARDGSIPINGYARIARYVRKNAAVLMRHVPGDFTVQLDNPDISAVPRRDPTTGSRLIYLVNKNAEKTASGELMISGLPTVDTAIDLYTDRKFSITTSGAILNMPFSLEKGEGRLLSLSVGQNGENNTESKMVPVVRAPL